MYFIKYQPLKTQLRDRSLSDREALPYLIIFMGLTTLVSSVPMFDGFNMWDGISAALSVLLAIGGVLYAYKENGGKEGYDFIQKYVVLGWVVCIRFLLAFIPVMILLVIFEDMVRLNSWDSTGPYEVAVIFFAEAILYQRIGRHIKDTKTEISEPNS